jgi:hypothetical protein
MSRYDEVAEKALDWTRRYFEHREQCQFFAREFALAYLKYLGTSSDRLQYLSLDKNLEYTNKLTPISGLPHLVSGQDGSENVAFSLRYTKNGSQYLDARFRIAIQKSGAEWTIVWSDMKFDIAEDKPEGLDVIFEKLLANSMELFDASISAPKRGIGFLPGSST